MNLHWDAKPCATNLPQVTNMRIVQAFRIEIVEPEVLQRHHTTKTSWEKNKLWTFAFPHYTRYPLMLQYFPSWNQATRSVFNTRSKFLAQGNNTWLRIKPGTSQLPDRCPIHLAMLAHTTRLAMLPSDPAFGHRTLQQDYKLQHTFSFVSLMKEVTQLIGIDIKTSRYLLTSGVWE